MRLDCRSISPNFHPFHRRAGRCCAGVGAAGRWVVAHLVGALSVLVSLPVAVTPCHRPLRAVGRGVPGRCIPMPVCPPLAGGATARRRRQAGRHDALDRWRCWPVALAVALDRAGGQTMPPVPRWSRPGFYKQTRAVFSFLSLPSTAPRQRRGSCTPYPVCAKGNPCAHANDRLTTASRAAISEASFLPKSA